MNVTLGWRSIAEACRTTVSILPRTLEQHPLTVEIDAYLAANSNNVRWGPMVHVITGAKCEVPVIIAR